MTDYKLLTKSELQVMLTLWAMPDGGAFTKELLQNFEEPKPAYTTLATFLKILSTKGYVEITKIGNMLYYRPKVTRDQYRLRIKAFVLETMYDGDSVLMLHNMLRNTEYTNEQIDQPIEILQNARK